MSYSFTEPCYGCKKKDQCTDRHFVRGAINGIHDVHPPEKGHLGAGVITLTCFHLEKVEV